MVQERSVRKVIVLGFLALLMGCSDKKTMEHSDEIAVEQDETVFAEQLEIQPELQGFHSYELGDLLKNLMLDDLKEKSLSTWNWDQLANDKKIYWVTEGYQEHYDRYNNHSTTKREGVARIHLLGERVSELKERKYEAPWSIRYEGGEAKFGVNTIYIQPEVDAMVTFPDPEPSLKKQNLKLEVICEQAFAGEHTKVTKISSRKKLPMYLIDRTSGGSAGESRWLELSMQDLSTEWCPDDGENQNSEHQNGEIVIENGTSYG